MKTPTASSATSSQREQTFLLSQVPRSPRSNGCSTPGLENPSASVHPKRFSTPSLTPKFLCAGKLNPRNEKLSQQKLIPVEVHEPSGGPLQTLSSLISPLLSPL